MTNPMHDQLPAHLASDPFLARFLAIFEEIHASVRDHSDSLPELLDPSLAPPEFVRWLGRWLDVLVEPSLPEAQQRTLVERASRFLPLRSTRVGLEGLLAAMTGGDVAIDDQCGVFPKGGAQPNPKHVSIVMETSGVYDVNHLISVIEEELSGDVTYDLRIDGESVRHTEFTQGSDYPIGLGVIRSPLQPSRPARAGTSRKRFDEGGRR
jgi:phage tail-like protein